jgi:hypothetical protein
MELWTLAISWLGGFSAGFVAGYLVKVFRDEPLDEADGEVGLSESKIPNYYFDHQRSIIEGS